MPSKYVYFLSTVVGHVVTAPVAGSMGVPLSDVYLTLPLNRGVKRTLEPGMVVVCKCVEMQGGFKTHGMAIVESFKRDGIVPDGIRHIYGDELSLGDDERVIDHRKGHKKKCKHG